MTEAYADVLFVGLSNGASAVWNASAASRKGVTIGTNGFSTLAAAITAVDAGGTVWLAAGTLALPTSITKNVVIRGLTATLTQTATCVVSGATVRFRDVTMTNTGASITCQIKATSEGLVGLTHCTLNGPCTYAAEANGVGSAIVLCGCDFGASVTNTKVDQKNGAAGAHFARTQMPAGGPSGRRGLHYRHKIRLEAPAEYREPSKAQRTTWVPVDEFYGAIEPLRGEEYMAARLAGANAFHKVEMPGGVTVSPVFRIVHRETTYELGTPLVTDQRENRLAFPALERVA